ncbi:MAG: ABC transporter permease [Clostridiales bacterium]|nr:ABC transporter permease [Clostridiales bacterium]
MKDKKTIIVWVVNALLLIIAVALAVSAMSISRTLLSQQAADFWKGESYERFAQISVFYPPDATKTQTEIMAFRDSIDKKLLDAGVEPKEQGKNWADAYCTQTKVQVEGERGASDATAIAVGGDFYLFHPYYLLSGSFISEDDLMQDRVVLDYELSWKLFGSTELEGMSVKIDGKDYYIAGVVKREEDSFSSRAYSGEPAIFMPYSALTEGEEETGISAYELVMLDPISNYAKTVVKEGIAGEKGMVVENSARYGFLKIFDLIINFGERSIETDGIIYPYWENAARLSEAYLGGLYVIIALILVFPLVCLSILLIKLIRFISKKIKFAAFKTWDVWDDRYARRDARKERKALKMEQDLPEGKASRFIKRRLKMQSGQKKEWDALSGKSISDFDVSLTSEEKELSFDIESIVKQVMEEGSSDSDFS